MTLRRVAYEVLKQIIENGAYANIALKKAASRVREGETSKLYALVYNALEHRSYVQFVLNCYCKKMQKSVNIILLLGASELLYLSTPAHAVISETVELTKQVGKRELAGFVNAVLRRVDRERESLPPLPADPYEKMSVLYGYPEFIIKEWIDSYGGEKANQIMQFQRTDLQIRPQYPFTPEELSASIGIPFRRGMLDPNCFYLEHAFDPNDNELYRSGRITFQNEGAMMICRAVPEPKGKRVLDACAAPGGKTAYLSSLSENDIELTAWELHPHRKELLDTTLARLGVSARTECRDASVYEPAYEGYFDRVLLDVPCSGFGLLADKPDLRYSKSEEDMESLIAAQRLILNNCAEYVRTGGYLIYATCTISERENRGQIDRFLSSHAEFSLLEDRQFLPFRDGTDGFYYAVLRR